MQDHELTVLIVILDSQGHDSQSDDANDSEQYFTETSFHLRKITEAPVAAGDDGQLVGEDQAELMQKLLDEQVLRLTSSDHMLKFLRRQNKDPLPCKRSDRHHVRNLWNRTYRRHGDIWNHWGDMVTLACCSSCSGVPLESTFLPVRHGKATWGKWCRQLIRTLLSL